MIPFKPGLPELLVILFIILLIFGASKLPQIGSSLGKGIREFRRSVSGETAAKSTRTKAAARRNRTEKSA